MKSTSRPGRETFGMLVKEFYVKSTFGRRTTNDMKLRTRIIDDSIKLRLSKSLNLQKASFFLSFFNREKSIEQSKLVPWMTTQRFSSNDFFFVFSDSIPDNEMIEDFKSTDPNRKQLSHVQGGAFPLCDSAFVQDGVDSCNYDPRGLTSDDHRRWNRSAVIVTKKEQIKVSSFIKYPPPPGPYGILFIFDVFEVSDNVMHDLSRILAVLKMCVLKIEGAAVATFIRREEPKTETDDKFFLKIRATLLEVATSPDLATSGISCQSSVQLQHVELKNNPTRNQVGKSIESKLLLTHNLGDLLKILGFLTRFSLLVKQKRATYPGNSGLNAGKKNQYCHPLLKKKRKIWAARKYGCRRSSNCKQRWHNLLKKKRKNRATRKFGCRRSEICIQRCQVKFKMAWTKVVGKRTAYSVNFAASKVDPVADEIYKLPLDYAHNGSEQFLYGQNGLGLPDHTRDGLIILRPKDCTERRHVRGVALKSTGVHWKITYLFAEDKKKVVEPLVRAAIEEDRFVEVEVPGVDDTRWRYSMFTTKTTFNQRQKYSTVAPDFNILGIPDLMAMNGSNYILEALKRKGFSDLSRVVTGVESTPSRKDAPTGHIMFWSSLVPSAANFDQVHKVPVEYKTRDVVTGEYQKHSVVLRIKAKAAKNPQDYKPGSGYKGFCRQCRKEGHISTWCPEVNTNGENLAAGSRRLLPGTTGSNAWNTPLFGTQPTRRPLRNANVIRNELSQSFAQAAQAATPTTTPQSNAVLDEVLTELEKIRLEPDTEILADIIKRGRQRVGAAAKGGEANQFAALLNVPNNENIPPISPRLADPEAKLRSEIAKHSHFEFCPNKVLVEIIDTGEKDDHGEPIEEIVINNQDHSKDPKCWDSFGAKLLGVNMLKNINEDGTPIWSNWKHSDDTNYTRKKGFKNLAWQIYITDWVKFKNLNKVGLNKYDYVDIVLSGNVGSLAKILVDTAKRDAFFEALNIDYRNIGWKVNFPAIVEVTTRSGTGRNHQAMADAVVCIITALRDHCLVSHDNFIHENYVTINGRRRKNNIKQNEL